MKKLAILFLLTNFATAEQFTGEQLKLKENMDSLFSVSKKVNDPNEMKMARGRIETAMEWDRVAKDCLGKTTWNSQSEANRTKFRNLLKEVIQKTAYTRLDKFWQGGTTYTISEVKVTGSEGYVKSKFKVTEDDFSLEYFLLKDKKGDWKIYDIAFDDLHYSKNIREQLDAFMKEGSFKQVLEKLTQRSKELDEPKTAESPKSETVVSKPKTPEEQKKTVQ